MDSERPRLFAAWAIVNMAGGHIWLDTIRRTRRDAIAAFDAQFGGAGKWRKRGRHLAHLSCCKVWVSEESPDARDDRESEVEDDAWRRGYRGGEQAEKEKNWRPVTLARYSAEKGRR